MDRLKLIIIILNYYKGFRFARKEYFNIYNSIFIDLFRFKNSFKYYDVYNILEIKRWPFKKSKIKRQLNSRRFYIIFIVFRNAYIMPTNQNNIFILIFILVSINIISFTPPINTSERKLQ